LENSNGPVSLREKKVALLNRPYPLLVVCWIQYVHREGRLFVVSKAKNAGQKKVADKLQPEDKIFHHKKA
jgi:hypothetical protein